MKTIIMAGGKGSRITGIASDIPKPMLPIAGKPILQHQIEVLSRYGLYDILIVTGFLGEKISNYFKDGSKFNVNISYYHETEPLGTAGALFKLCDMLGDSFLLVNGDIVFDIDFPRLFSFHANKNSMATVVSHPNDHPYDSALLETDSDNRITGWINKEEARTYYKNCVSSGIYILTKELINRAKENLKTEKADLDRDILKPVIPSKRLFAYNTPEYIKDIGVPDRFYQVEDDILKNRVMERNLSKRQKAVFLDRDGTINKENGFIAKIDDFELIEGAAEAVKKINNCGFLAIVITNQAVIARGDCSIEELEMIHKKMETFLGSYGAYIDDIFYCPHHPDSGFPGEQKEYKTVCDCRKPKPTMILKAAEKYNIDLTKSYMVGDSERDIQAGINAGCTPIFLTNDKNCQDFPGIKKYNNLKDFADSLISGK